MPISLRNRRENRPWTFVEWLQGKPLGHPSHPLFVHFPIASYLAVIVFDVMTLIKPNAGLIQAGTYLLVMAVLATLILLTTGLIDWFGMIKGSRKRREGTQHLWTQLAASSFFIVVLILRWLDRGLAEA